MKRVVVNDASVLIDLIDLDLLSSFFTLPFDFHLPYVIFESELYESQQKSLEQIFDEGGLILEHLSQDEVVKVYEIQKTKPKLSDKDIAAFLITRRLNATLLTSDQTLAKYARNENQSAHGILWIFDQLREHSALEPGDAIIKLERLLSQNPWFAPPHAEIDKRIKEWRSELK